MKLPSRIATIVVNVAAAHGVEPGDILGPSRVYRVSAARRHAMICVRGLTMPNGRPPSYPVIGAWFNRDHTTVIHACRDMQTEEQGALAL